MKKGDNVKFTGDVSESQINWGGNTDPRGILVEGIEYTIKSVDVRSFHTKIELERIDGSFNSVWFDVVE